MTNLSIAVSGGGHRATLFALGALQYVADAGTNAQTTSIASVSGGSITNGFIGQQVAFDAVDGAAFETSVTRPLVRQISTKGTLFAPWTTKAYVAALVVGAVAALVAPWLVTGVHWAVRIVICVVALAVVAAFAGLRGTIGRIALRRTLFSPGGTSTPLASMHPGTDIVLCSTELRSGDHFYFARDLAYGYQFGRGGPGEVDVATAVAASAALPGAFTPTRVATATLGFVGGRVDPAPSKLHLVDGGVYDNMGDQWATGYEARVGRLPEHYRDREPGEVIVVNASAGKDWVDRKGLGAPLWGEIAALLADQGIQYDNTTAHRRSALIAEFNAAEALGHGLRGTYVGINRSPYVVADAFIGHPERGARARAVIAALGDDDATRRSWQQIAATNAAEGTHLSKMPIERVASIVHHAYVSTMCNAHVILGHPLLSIPDRARFETN